MSSPKAECTSTSIEETVSINDTAPLSASTSWGRKGDDVVGEFAMIKSMTTVSSSRVHHEIMILRDNITETYALPIGIRIVTIFLLSIDALSSITDLSRDYAKKKLWEKTITMMIMIWYWAKMSWETSSMLGMGGMNTNCILSGFRLMIDSNNDRNSTSRKETKGWKCWEKRGS